MSQNNGRVSLHNAKPSINQRYAAFKLRVDASKIHRWGIFAEEFIPKGRKVVEYTGEKISRRETKRRAEERAQIYLFTLNNYWTIDGAVGGSGAEIINHSCEPNCELALVDPEEPGGIPTIELLTLRTISVGEELTIDYAWVDETPMKCLCATPSCRGWIVSP